MPQELIIVIADDRYVEVCGREDHFAEASITRLLRRQGLIAFPLALPDALCSQREEFPFSQRNLFIFAQLPCWASHCAE